MLFKVLKYDIVDLEVENVLLYYDSISTELGIRFQTEVERALDKLEINPAFYFVLEDKKHRRIIIEGFPYAFIYCIEKDEVIVKILFPQKEDPARLWIQLNYLR
ncbi:MAG: hypothetical protein ACTHOB_11430 [Ginsengibacter sp.]